MEATRHVAPLEVTEPAAGHQFKFPLPYSSGERIVSSRKPFDPDAPTGPAAAPAPIQQCYELPEMMTESVLERLQSVLRGRQTPVRSLRPSPVYTSQQAAAIHETSLTQRRQSARLQGE
jgi:hypothetical protein